MDVITLSKVHNLESGLKKDGDKEIIKTKILIYWMEIKNHSDKIYRLRLSLVLISRTCRKVAMLLMSVAEGRKTMQWEKA